MASVMTAQSILIRTLPLDPSSRPRSLSSPTPNLRFLSVGRTPKPLLVSHTPILAVRVSSSPSAAGPAAESLLAESTRTVCSILSAGASLSAVLSKWAHNFVKNVTSAPISEELASLRSLQNNLVCTVGPLFFAARGMDLNMSTSAATPFTVVAAGMAKWLDIFSGILMLRVLLSWFPNVPWDRQPLSAIRDLCDPYLNLFRNVIPPLFNSLDISPLLAFAILGVLSSLLNSSA